MTLTHTQPPTRLSQPHTYYPLPPPLHHLHNASAQACHHVSVTRPSSPHCTSTPLCTPPRFHCSRPVPPTSPHVRVASYPPPSPPPPPPSRSPRCACHLRIPTPPSSTAKPTPPNLLRKLGHRSIKLLRCESLGRGLPRPTLSGLSRTLRPATTKNRSLRLPSSGAFSSPNRLCLSTAPITQTTHCSHDSLPCSLLRFS